MLKFDIYYPEEYCAKAINIVSVWRNKNHDVDGL